MIETVISYRGTNYPAAGPAVPNPLNLPSDIYHGWTLGGGDLSSEQGLMAVEFYNLMVDDLYGTTIQANDASINISLVGHSLGGGLAGFVGANDNIEPLRQAA